MKHQFFAVLASIMLTSTFFSSPAVAELENLAAPGIENFTRLDESSGFAGPLVGFGGATQPSAMDWLKSNGFVTVINLRLETEEDANIGESRAAARQAGLTFIHLPFDPQNLTPDLVSAFVSAASNPFIQPVYIHCGSATRAAALWMVGRVQQDGWEIDAASAEAQQIAQKPDNAVALAIMYLTSNK